jgi:hypothetical protein
MTYIVFYVVVQGGRLAVVFASYKMAVEYFISKLIIHANSSYYYYTTGNVSPIKNMISSASS